MSITKKNICAWNAKMLKLISKMTADGLGHMIGRLGEEPEFYEEMVKKYLK